MSWSVLASTSSDARLETLSTSTVASVPTMPFMISLVISFCKAITRANRSFLTLSGMRPGIAAAGVPSRGL